MGGEPLELAQPRRFPLQRALSLSAGRGRLLPAVVAGALAGCGQGKIGAGATATTSAVVTASATASATGDATATTTASRTSAPELPNAREEEILREGSLVALAPRRGPGSRRGAFDAWLDGVERRSATAEPASIAAPTAHRAPLAFYRLARELGVGVVPVAVLRPMPVAELGAALGDAGAGALGELRVQNDGTVDVLLSARSTAAAGSPWEATPATPFDPGDEKETAALERWAGAGSPAVGEDGGLLRGYVEMLVLDYLAANVARRTALRSGSALILADNASAFPARGDGPTLDRMLRRLRAVARFPRGLRDALARFDRERARATFNGGPFDGWLLTPRTLVELDERRAALLTLVEARVAERGAQAVLAL